jgi:hypothetical protein
MNSTWTWSEKMKMKHVWILGLGLALLGPAALAAGKQAPDGHIYGTVYTEGDHEYTGLLRWGTEETFWNDLFNSTKDELPYLEEHQKETRRRNRITIFGIPVGYRWHEGATSRMFVARFGDIREIDVRRGQNIQVTMKDGEVFDMEGGSNDVGATVIVVDDALGDVKVEWHRIDRIVFKPTPRDVEPPAYRLYGVVTTDDDRFEGHIQWDIQECLSTDKLDGETDDGDLSIEMGHISAIEKRNRSGSYVELKDGRKLILEDTNDVDDSLRGIHVDDPRFGRVTISWEAFERVEFQEVDHSGRAYDDYKPGTKLSGTVTDYNDGTHSGQLIFDLDEARSWELLHGSRDDVEYLIPFDMIRSVEPQRGSESKVVLKSGLEIVLGDGQDVSESNDGIVVLRENGRESYIAWDELKLVTFD